MTIICQEQLQTAHLFAGTARSLKVLILKDSRETDLLQLGLYTAWLILTHNGHLFYSMQPLKPTRLSKLLPDKTLSDLKRASEPVEKRHYYTSVTKSKSNIWFSKPKMPDRWRCHLFKLVYIFSLNDVNKITWNFRWKRQVFLGFTVAIKHGESGEVEQRALPDWLLWTCWRSEFAQKRAKILLKTSDRSNAIYKSKF